MGWGVGGGRLLDMWRRGNLEDLWVLGFRDLLILGGFGLV